MKSQSNLIVYQTKTGAIQLKGDLKNESLWATQAQIVNIFGIDQSVVSRHIKKIFKDGEVSEKRNMQKMHIANSDKPVALYSLDVILAVGYRTNSSKAISFRQWATKTLRTHITQGFTINKTQVSKNYDKFMKAVAEVKKLLPASDLVGPNDALELAQLFASTWFSLDAYDKSILPEKGVNKKGVKITSDELTDALAKLKNDLLLKKEATDLFASERDKDGLSGIVGNIFQSFDGQDLYPTLEEKAAHLLYFIVKNHPFVDGNKRSGAFAFVWFLNRIGLLEKNEMSPSALTVLTLLVAESNPKDKDRMIGLILLLLKS